jgi:hypothetical protein
VTAITKNALVKRINRRLVREGLRLRRARGAQLIWSFGTFYVWDDRHQRPVETHVDPVALGREIGALRPQPRDRRFASFEEDTR